MGHHHGIRTHSFSFDALPHGFPSDPFSPLVDLFADPCGCHFDLGPTPFADAVADHCLGGAHQLGSVDCFLLDEQQDLTGAKTSAIQGEIAKAAQNTRAEKLSQRT